MNAQQQLLASVQSAIYALYHPHEQPIQHAQADAFLREFSVTNEAWEIAGILILHSQSFEERFFGCQFLYLKLTKQWNTLVNKQQQNQIRDLIMQGILSSFSMFKIMEKLCMCLAVFTLKKIEETSETIDALKLFTMFSLPNVNLDYTNDDPSLLQGSPITPPNAPLSFPSSVENKNSSDPSSSNTNGVMTSSSISPTTVAPTAAVTTNYVVQPFLMWLSFVAETVDVDHLIQSEWTKLRHQLNHAIDDILNFCMSAVANSRITRTQNLAINCLQKWIKYGIPLSTIYRDGSVFDLAFKCLVHPSLFEESASLLSEILSQRPKEEYNDRMRNCALKLTSLSHFYEQSLKNEDIEICREIVKLIVTFGESNTTLIAGGNPECIQLVKFICMCVRNPEKQIVELTYDFWYTLQTQINFPESRDLFKPIFSEMATILISHCRYPVLQPDETMDSDDLEEFQRFRNETADVLTTVYELLFSDYFTLCMNGIKQGFLRYNHDKTRWQLIESSLFAILSVSDCVKHEQLANLAPIVQMYNSMPSDIVEIRHVQVQILGSYAHWVCKQNEDFIMHAINFTLQSVYHFSQLKLPQRAPAAKSFCTLCTKAESTVSSNLNLASTLIQSCMSNIDRILDAEIQIELYRSLSHVLFAVSDMDAQLKLMHFILQGVINRIKNYHDAISEANIGSLNIELRKLQASMEACNGAKGSRTLLTVIQQIWSLLCETMIGYKMSCDVISQFCRLFNCMVCSVGVFPETLDFMNNITLLLYKMYYEIPYPSFLGTINVITCALDGQDANTSVYQSLAANYMGICAKTFEIADFLNNDDLVMEFFKLQSSVMKSHPLIFFAREDAVEAILDKAVSYIGHQNAEAMSQVVRFIVGFLEFDAKTHARLRQTWHELLKCISPKLVPAVLKAILFQNHPASRELLKVLYAYRHNKIFLTTFADNFIRFDRTIEELQAIPQAEKASFVNSLGICNSSFRLRDAIEKFKKTIAQAASQ